MTEIKRKIKIDPALVKNLKELYRIIKHSKGVIVTGHINPDGDDIGSQLALGWYLKSINKKYIIAEPEDLPMSFKFLPGSEDVRNIEKIL